MAIQNRRGADADFDSHKMLPGELAVTTDGSRKVYATFAPGDSREVAFKDQIPVIGNVTPAEVQNAVDNYLTENPVQAGATKEQAKQIELNRQNIELNKEEIDKANANIAQIANSNLFINGNFQIWSNEQSFEVYGTNNEGTTTVICDKWYAKHYDLENNYYITKAGAQGIRLFSASEEPCYIYQILDEETFNALQGKTVTLSWSYTQSYGDANHVEYETIEESEQILVGTDLDVFTAMTKIGFTNGIAGCIIHWIKMEVGELKTPCVPDSKDAIICKLEQEIDDLNDKLTNKTTWKYLGEATNGNKLTLPNPDDYEELMIVVSASDADSYCKYTFSLCKYLIENFYTGAYEYLKEGSYANEYYYSEIIVEFSNSKNGNYIKLNTVRYKGNDIGGTIYVCYR